MLEAARAPWLWPPSATFKDSSGGLSPFRTVGLSCRFLWDQLLAFLFHC